MNSVIEVKNLYKKYDDFALRNISFKLQKGKVMGFIGPNGAGKTTMIRLMMNLIRKDGGDIRLFGYPHDKNQKYIKNRVGFVYDQNFFIEELSVKMCKAMIAPFYDEWDDDLFNYYTNRFELPLNRQIKNLSQGMKTKLYLAIALSHHAQLIIMDEPTSGLDPVFREELLKIIREIVNVYNVAIFFSTHITADLEKIADEITFINKGRLIFSERTEVIGRSFQKVMLDHAPFSTSDNLLIGLHKSGDYYTAITNQFPLVEAKYRPVSFVRATLEDIMLYHIEEDRRCLL
ncbi:ABC transporter ATP-binding protein [Thermoflavimicrobium daqui]|uniref:Sodium ABC transporter ATP-binding protein n=1 Tax=Thermoflavimicrobium daqui TaxID=2137476 RepID=A0A364K8P9_9BACL|nr:ABC transporter ATP-binding protein [Thermoflavimicrobium daqui]RAL26671.1 sodium ABC transporter ATP-binding protein [Thermoflavimicrobium daqui]